MFEKGLRRPIVPVSEMRKYNIFISLVEEP